MATKRTVIFDFKTTGVNISDQMKKAEESTARVTDKMKTMGGTLSRLTVPIGLAAGGMVKLASDMEETMNKIDVSFGDSAQGVKDWATTSIEKMGLAQQTALDTAALFGDMGTGMGQNSVEAAKMSTGLTQLSADLASFKNVKQDVAKTALAGIYTGETESLKQLGIVMTEVNLEEYARSQGINKSMSEMSQAEKVQLRYNYVMAQTTKAQGDFERTGGGAANQSRMFTEQLKELGVQFGQIILPIATKIITKLNEMLVKFGALSPTVKTIILVVLGLVAAIGPMLLIAAKVITIFGKIKTAITIVRTAMMALGASAMLPFLPIIAAVAAVIAIIVLLVKHWDKVKAAAMIVAKFLFNVFKSVWAKIKSVIYNIINAFNIVKTAIITAFKAVKSFIKSVFTTIGNIIKVPINAIIKGINKVLKMINKIKIPDWVPVIGGKSANFGMIPTLAKGGIVNSATQAIIGEGADPEAVVPLNKTSISNFVSGLGMTGTGQNVTISIAQAKVAMVDLNGNVIGNIILPQITRKLKLGGALT